MKKFLLIAAVTAAFALPVFAEKQYNVDDAISLGAKELSAKIPEGTKLVVINIKSESEKAGEYVVNELTLDLLNAGKFVVVDRASLEEIRQELSFQTSGDVSDESAQRLGAMLGAETLITGSLDQLSDRYRLSLKAVKVETAELQYLNTLTVQDSAEMRELFGKTPAAASRAKTTNTVGSAILGFFDFTGRFICMTVNPFFGIGSYMQGDTQGGGTVAFWEVAGIATAWYGTVRQNNNESNGELITGVGGLMVTGAVVYSLIRPWTYNRAPKVAQVLDHVNVGFTSENDLSVGFKLAF